MNNLGEQFLAAAKILCEIAHKAERNSHSLNGKGFYAEKFHAQIVVLHKLESKFHSATSSLSGNAQAEKDVETIKSAKREGRKRTDALRRLGLFVHGEASSAFSDQDAPPNPTSEPVLPKAVVIPTKKSYLINIVIQANACYEARCHDACAVLIRKLVEILIIELYESAGRQDEIKNGAGDYLMLSDLIDRLKASDHWHLGRETKSTLPKLKALGDRAAHNRRFVATTGDINPVIPGLRAVIDDLLHLAGLK